MELRRPLLIAAALVLTTAAGVPSALRDAPPAEAAQARLVAQVRPDAVPVGPLAATPVPVGPRRVAAAGTTTVPTSWTRGGRTRDVVLHVPEGVRAPAPLVVALHAHSQGPDAVRTYSRLEALADEQGFVVAFPTGADGSWNAGTCCTPASAEDLDDVAYLDEVLRVVRERVPVDPTRIGITGGSNGAMMALRYACERPAQVTAVAVVSGPYVGSCTPRLPVPVLVLHGARDGAVPLGGGPNTALRTSFPPVDRSLDPFRATGAEVRLQVVPTAAHEWMGQERHGVDATRAIWDWVRDHPRTAGALRTGKASPEQ